MKYLPLKRLFRVVGGSTPGGEAENWDGEICWVTPEDMSALGGREILGSRRTLTKQGYANCGTRMVPAGSVVVTSRAPIGNVGVAARALCTNQGCKALVPRESVSSSYYYFVLVALSEALQALGRGSTFTEISGDRLGAMPVPVPSLVEQRAIADFLDEKTAAIDALIARKERLLALLDEKRQALITQAVTKGLDPSVPMKESGIPSIGMIPVGWRVVRLKHLSLVRTGIPKGRVLDGPTVSIPYLRVANVQAGYLLLDEVTEMEVLPNEVARFALRPGDVLMNEGGDNDKLGRGTVWRGQIAPCAHQNHVFAVRPRNVDLSEWIALSTLGGVLRAFFQGRAKQSTNLASISSSNLKEAPIVLPPDEARRAIENTLRQILERAHTQKDKLEKSIDRLREYRRALITAAVTGQLDVRSKQAGAMEPAA